MLHSFQYHSHAFLPSPSMPITSSEFIHIFFTALTTIQNILPRHIAVLKNDYFWEDEYNWVIFFHIESIKMPRNTKLLFPFTFLVISIAWLLHLHDLYGCITLTHYGRNIEQCRVAFFQITMSCDVQECSCSAMQYFKLGNLQYKMWIVYRQLENQIYK